MTVALSVSMIAFGAAMACLPMFRPAYAEAAERIAGLLLIGGLTLFGTQLSLAV